MYHEACLCNRMLENTKVKLLYHENLQMYKNLIRLIYSNISIGLIIIFETIIAVDKSNSNLFESFTFLSYLYSFLLFVMNKYKSEKNKKDESIIINNIKSVVSISRLLIPHIYFK